MVPNDVRLTDIGQIAINVHDLDEAVTSYRDVLGMDFLFQVPGIAFFDCGGVRLMLGLPEREEFDHPSSVVYYRVEDIDRTHEALRDRGVSFIGKPHKIATLADHELWMAFFLDVDENVLALMCKIPLADP